MLWWSGHNTYLESEIDKSLEIGLDDMQSLERFILK